MLAQEEARRLGHNFVGTEQVSGENIERANGRGFGARGGGEGGVGEDAEDATLGLSGKARRAGNARRRRGREECEDGARGRVGGVEDARARARRRDTDGD